MVFTLSLSAQELKTVRLEVPAELDVEAYHIEPIGKYGVLIFYESNELNIDNKRKWYLGLFNTNLNQQWLKYIELEDKMQFVKSTLANNKIYLLFRNLAKGRNEDGFYEIVSLDFISHKIEEISGTFPPKAEIVAFETLGKTACLALNIKKSGSDLVFIDLETGNINPVKLAEEDESHIESVYANKVNNNFYVALKVRRDNRYIEDFIHILTNKGKSLNVVKIVTDNNIKILRKFQFFSSPNNQLSVFGIYDLQTGKIPDFNDMDDEDNPKSAGLFFFKLDNAVPSTIRYFDFASLNNIHGSISNRSTTKVKIDDPALSGSQNVKKYNGAFFNINKPLITLNNNAFVFSAELYKPHYKTETRMDYDFYGRPYPYTYSVFAGYQFFDIIVVSLTENGDLIWNNDFIIRDLKSFSLERHTAVFGHDNLVSAVYVNNGKINSIVFDGSIDVDSDETIIATNHSKDRIVQDENNHIMKWYDDYFLIYGYQKINNRSLSKQNERSTFFINKVAFK